MTKRVLVYLVVIAVSLFSVWTAQQSAEKANENADQIRALAISNTNLTTSLQRAIVESCEENGNSRAEVLRETLHEEITEAENPDPELLAALDIPPETVERIIGENIAKLEDRLDRVKIVDCGSQYRISPGSGDARRERNK